MTAAVGRMWKAGANVVILFVLGFPLFEMIVQGENYPFGAYTMYSNRYSLDDIGDGKTLMYGVFDGGVEHPIVGYGYVNETRIRSLYNQLRDTPDQRKVTETEMARALDLCIHQPWCQGKGRDGEEYGRFLGLRIYQVSYATVDELRERRPSSRQLLAEAMAPKPERAAEE